jgi:hypothetical protein
MQQSVDARDDAGLSIGASDGPLGNPTASTRERGAELLLHPDVTTPAR